MDKLNQRQKEFLDLLLQQTGYVPIQSFAEKLGVSGKTLKEDVKILRSFLKKYSGEIMTKTGKGVCLTKETYSNAELRNYLSGESRKKETFPGGRRAEILKNMLLYSEQFISLQKLSEQYYVGKSSIVNDFKYIEEWLKRFRLHLEKNKQGTRIAGEERDIREAITSLLCQEPFFESESAAAFAERVRLDRDTVQGLLELFRPEDVAFAAQLLEELQETEDLDRNDIYYKNLLTHLLICIQRAGEGKRISGRVQKPSGQKAQKSSAYESAVRISGQIRRRYGVEIGEEETDYIYQYICSLTAHGNAGRGIQGEENFSDRIAESLTQYMEKMLDVKFIREEMLTEGLLLHIRPLLNRLQYQIKIANPLLKEMQKSYPQILGACQIACALVEKNYHLPPISLDEIGNLATYYQTALVKQTDPVNVIVVCHSGYGTSQLLEAMLKQQFPNLNIRAVVSARKLKQMDIKETDFIISTVPVDAGKTSHLVVSSFLTDKDISSIRNRIDTASQKEKKGYPILAEMLPEENIFIDEPDGQKTGDILVNASMAEKLEVSVRAGRAEAEFLTLSVNHQKERIRFDICTEEGKITAVLSEIYRMALNEENLTAVLACRDKRSVRKYLLGEGGRERPGELLKSENVLLDRKAETKEEVIRILIRQVLKERDSRREEELVKAVYQREALSFTGIGKRTALVHAQTNAVQKTETVFLRTAYPVDWAKGKAYPEEVKMIRIAVLFLIPEEERPKETEKVKTLVLKLGKKETAEKLLRAETRQDVIHILSSGVKK